MNKILFLFAFYCFTSCNNVNKEELKKEIIAELKSANNKPSVVKGSGDNFMLNQRFWVVLAHI